MAKYKTKPCEIEAIQWNGLNLEEIKEFVGKLLIYNICDTAWEVGKGRPHVDMKIKTLEGNMQASVGDYIIKGLRGEYYPCKPDVFEKKYMLVNGQTNADRIQSMSYEELAEFLVNFKNTFGEEYEGEISCLEWLQSEVEEEQ